MLQEYIQAALKRADYHQLEDTSWFASIPPLPGVWSNAQNVEACRQELREVLEEWLLMQLQDGVKLPVIDGVDLEIHSIGAHE